VVTRPQIEKLSARIEALLADGNGRPVYVWRDAGESEAEALDRHYEQHPEDRSAKQVCVFQWLEA
jgi:hypothetical protein